MLLGFFAPGPLELSIIGIIALLLFGKRLPGVARAVGSSFSQFKAGLKDIEDETKDAVDILKDEADDVRQSLNG